MSDLIQGKVTFINHEKKYAILEYLQSGKKKTVNGSIDDKVQRSWKEKNLIKKTHHFLTGDIVNFKLQISERGDKMVAVNINFLYNNALDVLVNKAKTENRFIGYLKQVDDDYFVKEIDSYLFFQVPIAKWQMPPTEKELNEQVDFSLTNLDKKEKIVAALFNNDYIPEFSAALKLYKSKTATEATVYEIKPHGIYLNIIGEAIKAKIPVGTENSPEKNWAVGDKVNVMITYLDKNKIIVEPVI
jgi:ribosomal protein S1